MRRETRLAAKATADVDPLDVIARARARLADLPPVPDDETQPRLPSNQTVPLVTLTTDQLHDLVYAATSNYLRTLAGMSRARAQHHASRISIEAQALAVEHGRSHRGDAP